MSEYIVKTFRERSDKLDENWRIVDEGWAEFLLNDTRSPMSTFGRLYKDFPEFQFMLYDGDIVVADLQQHPGDLGFRPEAPV